MLVPINCAQQSDNPNNLYYDTHPETYNTTEVLDGSEPQWFDYYPAETAPQETNDIYEYPYIPRESLPQIQQMLPLPEQQILYHSVPPEVIDCSENLTLSDSYRKGLFCNRFCSFSDP